MQTGIASAALSLMVIGAFLLGAGAMWQIAKGRANTKSLLMLAAALVLLGNVLIWTL